MSQFDPNNPAAQFDPTDPLLAGPPRVSKLAVAALVCSFIFCCPLTSILGLLLGAGGVVSVATSYGARRGMWMALLAIVVSIASLGGQGWVGYTVYEKFIEPLMRLPQEFLATVENGDFNAARQLMTSPLDQNVTDEQIEVFRQSLADRYGSCTGWQILELLGNSGSGQTLDLSGQFTFTKGVRDARVAIDVVQTAPGTRGSSRMFYISEIIIEDPDLGDLVFPPKQ